MRLSTPLAQSEIALKSDERLLSVIIYSVYRGDLNAVRELAAQFAEDMASDNVIYTEARFCPHLLVSNHYPLVSMYVWHSSASPNAYGISSYTWENRSLSKTLV